MERDPVNLPPVVARHLYSAKIRASVLIVEKRFYTLDTAVTNRNSVLVLPLVAGEALQSTIAARAAILEVILSINQPLLVGEIALLNVHFPYQ